MKKITILVLLACMITVFAFSQNFTVQSVNGRVEREAGSQRVEVKPGEILGSDTVIYTLVGASVVLIDESGRPVTVPSARNGSVAELTRASAGIRIGGNVASTNTGTVTRTVAQVGTASARASDAAREEDIAAE